MTKKKTQYNLCSKKPGEKVWHWDAITFHRDEAYRESHRAFLSLKGLIYMVEEVTEEGTIETIFEPDPELIRRYRDYFIPEDFWSVPTSERDTWLDDWKRSGGGVIHD